MLSLLKQTEISP